MRLLKIENIDGQSKKSEFIKEPPEDPVAIALIARG